MKTSIKGMIELADNEGIVLSPYLDSVGVWTIGIGHTAAAGLPDPARMARGVQISLDAVVDMFERDLVKYEKAVEQAFSVPLTQNQFDAAVDFHYNTGAIKRATWVKQVNAGRVAEAARSIMLWNKAAGKVSDGLTSRRRRERDLFFHGTYSNKDGKATCYPASKAGKIDWDSGKRIDLKVAFIPRADPIPPLPEKPIQNEVEAPVNPAPAKPVKEKGGWLAALLRFLTALFRKG